MNKTCYKEPGKKVVVRVGQIYRRDESDALFILTVVGVNRVQLTSLYAGTRWSEAVAVERADNITSEEWERISDNEFSLLPGGTEITIMTEATNEV